MRLPEDEPLFITTSSTAETSTPAPSAPLGYTQKGKPKKQKDREVWAPESFHHLRAQSTLGFERQRIAGCLKRETKHIFSKIQKHMKLLNQMNTIMNMALDFVEECGEKFESDE